MRASSLCILLMLLLRWNAAAQSGDLPPAPRLHDGATEIGVAGSLTAVDVVSYATITLRLGRFFTVGPGMLSAGVDGSYTRIGSLDRLEIGPEITFGYGLGSVYPFIGIGGGVREEWLGSFRQARYPVGADLGLRALLSKDAAIETGYQFRRVLGDPVAEYSEHRMLLGLSLLLGN